MIDGIITRIQNVLDSEFGQNIGYKGFSFNELKDSETCTYISLPVLLNLESSQAFGKILLGDLAYAVGKIHSRDKIYKKPIGVYVDELSSFLNENYIQILNKARSAQVELTSAFQSTADIDQLGPEYTEQLFENNLNWFVMKQRMPKAAESLSRALGTYQASKLTERVEDGVSLGMGSQRIVEEFLVHPNIIKSLGQGQAILLRHRPVSIELLNLKYIDQTTINSNLAYMKKYGLIEEVKLKKKKGILDE
tara:strand:+ start:1742 stop:2491 length:750 start_codon:yes stop_codon:yes gene_type:complete